MPPRLYDRFFKGKSFATRVVGEALVYSSIVISILAGYFVYVMVVHGLAFAISSSNVAWFVETTLQYLALALFAAILSVSLQVLHSRMSR